MTADPTTPAHALHAVVEAYEDRAQNLPPRKTHPSWSACAGCDGFPISSVDDLCYGCRANLDRWVTSDDEPPPLPAEDADTFTPEMAQYVCNILEHHRTDPASWIRQERRAVTRLAAFALLGASAGSPAPTADLPPHAKLPAFTTSGATAYVEWMEDDPSTPEATNG